MTCASLIILFATLQPGDFRENFTEQTKDIHLNEYVHIIRVPGMNIDHVRHLINQMPDFVAVSRIYEHFYGTDDDMGTIIIRKFR